MYTSNLLVYKEILLTNITPDNMLLELELPLQGPYIMQYKVSAPSRTNSTNQDQTKISIFSSV